MVYRWVACIADSSYGSITACVYLSVHCFLLLFSLSEAIAKRLDEDGDESGRGSRILSEVG